MGIGNSGNPERRACHSLGGRFFGGRFIGGRFRTLFSGKPSEKPDLLVGSQQRLLKALTVPALRSGGRCSPCANGLWEARVVEGGRVRALCYDLVVHYDVDLVRRHADLG